MEKKYTFWERIISDTPAFFKQAQMFGASLVVLSVSLSEIKAIPVQIVTVLASIGCTIAALAQFAVKQCETVNPQDNDEAK
jgi:hypothetical protein